MEDGGEGGGLMEGKRNSYMFSSSSTARQDMTARWMSSSNRSRWPQSSEQHLHGLVNTSVNNISLETSLTLLEGHRHLHQAWRSQGPLGTHTCGLDVGNVTLQTNLLSGTNKLTELN